MARILIIEDNPENLELMRYLLNAFGYQTVTAMDGEAGLAAAQREAVDLIVCDVHLPKLDGYQVARALRADVRLARLPLVAVTALAMVGDRDKVLAAGFDGYIAKPITPQEFVPQVEAFIMPALRPPVRAPTPAAAESAAHPAAVPTARARILVVDDSQHNRDLARATLEPFGYVVTLASRVREARTLMAQTDFDLILSDLHMPTEDGFGFLSSVRSAPRLRSLPFMLISSSVWGPRDQVRGLELGATRFLMRPLTPQQLLAEVEACLAEREQ